MARIRIGLGRVTGVALGMGALLGLAACGDGSYAQSDASTVQSPGPARNPNTTGDASVFGEGGLSVSRLRNGRLLGGSSEQGGSLPVNRFMWQAALETLDFMPLASTDPYTGVIATDWSTSPTAPNERVKVTVYIVNPDLAASALKVAVFREARSADGLWLPAPVSPDTPRKLEDAILTKARQIKIADLEGTNAG